MLGNREISSLTRLAHDKVTAHGSAFMLCLLKADLRQKSGLSRRNLLIATMETLLIESVEPAQNRRRGDDFKAVEFLQADDPEIKEARVNELTQMFRRQMLS